MSEAKKARIRIISRLTEPDGDVHEIKNARSGLLRTTADGTVLCEFVVPVGTRSELTIECMPFTGMTDVTLIFAGDVAVKWWRFAPEK